MPRASQQLELRLRTWGGRRPGAGRTPAPGRRAVPHRPRTRHDRHCPAHVTLRATSGVPSLRHGASSTLLGAVVRRVARRDILRLAGGLATGALFGVPGTAAAAAAAAGAPERRSAGATRALSLYAVNTGERLSVEYFRAGTYK